MIGFPYGPRWEIYSVTVQRRCPLGRSFRTVHPSRIDITRSDSVAYELNSSQSKTLHENNTFPERPQMIPKLIRISGEQIDTSCLSWAGRSEQHRLGHYSFIFPGVNYSDTVIYTIHIQFFFARSLDESSPFLRRVKLSPHLQFRNNLLSSQGSSRDFQTLQVDVVVVIHSKPIEVAS